MKTLDRAVGKRFPLLIAVFTAFGVRAVNTSASLVIGDFKVDPTNNDNVTLGLELFDGRNDTCFSTSEQEIFVRLQSKMFMRQIIIDFAGLEGYGEFTVIPRNFDDPVDEPTCSSTSGIQIDCSPMVYADSLEIRVNSSENVTFCEITIQGFLDFPPLNASAVFINAYDVSNTGVTFQYADIHLFLNFPLLKLEHEFGPPVTYTVDQAPLTLLTSSQARELSPGVEHEVKITRIFNDTLTKETLEGEETLTAYFSRGPYCWSGQCETDQCSDALNSSQDGGALLNETSAANGVCYMIDSSANTPGEKSFGALPGTAESPYNCTRLCKLQEAVDIPRDFICGHLSNIYCCGDDFCLSPLEEPPENISCLHTLQTSGEQQYEYLNQCSESNGNLGSWAVNVPPIILNFSTLTAEMGELTFYIADSVSGFDYVLLYFEHPASESFSSDMVSICRFNDESEPGVFLGNKTHSCGVAGLTANTEYNISLQGHNPEFENDSFGGVTQISEPFSISQGGTFSLNCETDGYSIDFFFGDLQSSQDSISFDSTSVATTPDDTSNSFSDQMNIQLIWPNHNVFVPPETKPLFRGFPSSISIHNDSDFITALFSGYDFAEVQMDFNNENTKNTLNLTNKRVSAVSGSFVDGALLDVMFVTQDEIGSEETSPCFGAGSCSSASFNESQKNANQFLVGFSGRTNETGYIVELNLLWVTADISEFYVGIEECAIERSSNWHDIIQFSFSYNVSPLDGCANTQTVYDADHTIVYTNSVRRQGESDSFGNGTMIASRLLSAAASLQCTYKADQVVSAVFNTHGEATKTVSDVNHLTFEMRFYTDSSFTNQRSSEGVLFVNTGERLYIGVSFADNSDYNMTLYAHTCYSKKTEDPEMAADGSDYLLLQENGCPVNDDSFTRYEAVRKEYRDMLDPVSFLAFYWFDDVNEVVHLHCKVRACTPANKQQCEAPQSCGKARRDVGNLMMDLPQATKEDSYVSSQPIAFIHRAEIQIMASRKSILDDGKLLPLSFFCSAAALFLLLILNAYCKQKRIQGYLQFKSC